MKPEKKPFPEFVSGMGMLSPNRTQSRTVRRAQEANLKLEIGSLFSIAFGPYGPPRPETIPLRRNAASGEGNRLHYLPDRPLQVRCLRLNQPYAASHHKEGWLTPRSVVPLLSCLRCAAPIVSASFIYRPTPVTNWGRGSPLPFPCRSHRTLPKTKYYMPSAAL